MRNTNIFWFNVYFAVGWLVFYLSFILNKGYEAGINSERVLSVVTAIYGFLILVFSVAAFVFATKNKGKFNLFAEALNYVLILIVIIPFVWLFDFCCSSSKIINENAIPFMTLIGTISFILFMLPSIINIRALSAARR